MRPIDLARPHGLSAQAIRNYEDAGVLPTADRADTGYRRYTPLHAQALATFLALRRGHGHGPATQIMSAVNVGDLDLAFRLIDATHHALRTDRETQAQVAAALVQLSGSPRVVAPGRPLTIGELARRLGLHAATLRDWERAGILRPERDRASGYRHFGTDAVRDAEIARQLRLGGYPLTRIGPFLDTLHTVGGEDALAAFLDTWQQRITDRSRALLAGAGALDAYLAMRASAS